jgi:hypothetical protein
MRLKEPPGIIAGQALARHQERNSEVFIGSFKNPSRLLRADVGFLR